MSNSRSNARPRRRPVLGRRRAGAVSLVLAAAATLAAGAAPAVAHGGNTQLVHSCIGGGGNIKIGAAPATCGKNEVPLDWPSAAATNTYSAGSGLALSPSNVFSVTGAPWSGLTGVPAGFSDGIDDEGPALTWGNLADIPGDLADGDDDGSAAASAAVSGLRTSLAQNAGNPNQDGGLVSFSQIKDLTSGPGQGRITGEFIANGSIGANDLADDSVDGDTIDDGSVHSADLAPGVLRRTNVSTTVDPPSIPSGARMAVPVTDLFSTVYSVNDLVTVSPPATLDPALVYAGSDVLADGTLVVYLHNISAGLVDGVEATWTIRRLGTGG